MSVCSTCKSGKTIDDKMETRLTVYPSLVFILSLLKVLSNIITLIIIYVARRECTCVSRWLRFDYDFKMLLKLKNFINTINLKKRNIYINHQVSDALRLFKIWYRWNIVIFLNQINLKTLTFC